MANQDLNPDDLLEFHFDRDVPADSKNTNESASSAGSSRGMSTAGSSSGSTAGSSDKDFELFDELIESAKQRSSASAKGRGLGDAFDSYDEYKRYEDLRSRKASSAASAGSSGLSTGSGMATGSASRSGSTLSSHSAAQSSGPASYSGSTAGSRSSAQSSGPASYSGSTAGSRSSAQSSGSASYSGSTAGSRSSAQSSGSAPRSGNIAGSRSSFQVSAGSAGGFDMQSYIEPPLSSRRSVSADDQRSLYENARAEARSGSSSRRAPVEEPPERGLIEDLTNYGGERSAREIKAIKQASQEAYDRYRSNYTKQKQKKEGTGKTKAKVSGFHKFLTVIYTIALVAFAGSMTVMNVLPFKMLIVLYVVLALLSLIILIQTRKEGVKKWGKGFATFLAIVLIGVYGTGAAYALGTLSFLSDTSVDNEKAVARITREPFNVVITGMDVSGTIDEEGRSDVNMILTVNPDTATVLMTSIPRDYEIYMPDHDGAMDKLTHTGFYGVQTTILAEEELLGITANYYVKVNFTTVEKFIDAIGGVDVYSEYEFTPVKMKDWTVKEGMNHMNGKQALAFARERKAFITGDNQRIKNQQAVFEAMFKKATSSRTMIFNYSKILTNLHDYFEMSFSSREIRSLAKMQLARFPDWSIYKNTIVGGDGTLDTYSAGWAYVMTQDQTSIDHAKELINAVLEGGALVKDDEGVVSVYGGSDSDSDSSEDD